jgi:long-chain acyl-CoA synthetase
LELVRKIHLTPLPFTIDNGILTPTMKLIRSKAADYYRDVIEELYSSNLRFSFDVYNRYIKIHK